MAVDLSQTLDIMDRRDANGNRVPFSLRWVSFDKHRPKVGSQHKYCAAAVRGGASHDLHRHGQVAIHPLDGGHPIPVNMDLITHINDSEVQ